jgi:outer membrane protein assembly factor BamB
MEVKMRKIIHFLRIKNFKLSLLSLFILIAIFANINCNNTYHFKHSNNPIWPMFQYDARRTGQCPYDTSKNNGNLKWKFKTDDYIYSSPAISSEGAVYTGYRNLYAINSDGTLKWKFEIGGVIYSSPAISSDSTVYVGSNDGYLYAINPNGTLKWKFKANNGIQSTPAIAPDGTVYFGAIEEYLRGSKIGSNDNYFYALNSDGSLKWKFKVKEGRYYSSPVISKDGAIYVGVDISSDDDYLYAINPDGTLKWKFKPAGSSPAISSDGTIYVGSNDGYLYAIGGK